MKFEILFDLKDVNCQWRGGKYKFTVDITLTNYDIDLNGILFKNQFLCFLKNTVSIMISLLVIVVNKLSSVNTE